MTDTIDQNAVQQNLNRSMVLHCGGREVTIDEVISAQTPMATRSHVPIPHIDLITSVRNSLGSGGYRILGEKHAMSKEGARYFGVLQIANGGGHAEDYGWMVSLRNSHDKTFVAGLSAGSRVFVCDNLAFSGEVKVSRKHTTFIRRDLGLLVNRAVGRLNDSLGLMDERIGRYKEHALTDSAAHDLLIRSIDARAIMAQDLPHVLGEWRKPSHEEFRPRTAWSLFNAYTERHKRLNDPGILLGRGEALHGLFDSLVGLSKGN